MLSYFSRQKTAANKWEHSSAGRASALQAEGHRFEPYSFHHISDVSRKCSTLAKPNVSHFSSAEMLGPVVQLVRTLACHARGRRFEPDPGRQPNADLAHPVERHLAKVEVASSSLVIRSKKDA